MPNTRKKRVRFSYKPKFVLIRRHFQYFIQNSVKYPDEVFVQIFIVKYEYTSE